MSKAIGDSDSFLMPIEPLQDGWGEKWDDEALDYRLSRFGLRLQEKMEGYSVVFATSGNPLSLLDMNYSGCSHNDVCDLVQDLELTERLKRSGLDVRLLS